jgi:hypothetical protein
VAGWRGSTARSKFRQPRRRRTIWLDARAFKEEGGPRLSSLPLLPFPQRIAARLCPREGDGRGTVSSVFISPSSPSALVSPGNLTRPCFVFVFFLFLQFYFLFGPKKATPCEIGPPDGTAHLSARRSVASDRRFVQLHFDRWSFFEPPAILTGGRVSAPQFKTNQVG